MKQEILSQFQWTWAPVVGLLLFLACFLIYVFYTYRKSNKHWYQQAASIPLQEAHKVEAGRKHL